MTNLLGHSLGRYHILEQLGQGGMATVYKAYDTRLERDVAVKVIRAERLNTEDYARSLKRFEREASAMARLTHSNIVRILDYGFEHDLPYLVMELMLGGTLREQLGAPTSWQQAFSLLLPLVSGLEYAHQKGVIHRDVKPSNVLFSEQSQPMLSDFSIAKFLDSENQTILTRTNMVLGTPAYMAPEQIHSKEVDQRVDIYALGVILYEMITGRKPFNGKTPFAVMMKISTEPLPSPRLFVPTLPVEIEAILLQALAKRPEERFDTMGVVRQALQNALLTIGTGQASLSPCSSVSTQDDEVTRDVLEEPLPGKMIIICPFCHQPTTVNNWNCARCGSSLQTAALVMKRAKRN